MVQNIALNHIWDVSDGAKLGGVIVAGTRNPRATRVVLNVHLSGGVREAQELPGNNRDRILFVVNVGHRYRHAVGIVHRVDVVGEGGVAHPRHAVTDHAHACASWQVQWEVDRVEKGEGRTERVSCDDHGGCVVSRE